MFTEVWDQDWRAKQDQTQEKRNSKGQTHTLEFKSVFLFSCKSSSTNLNRFMSVEDDKHKFLISTLVMVHGSQDIRTDW